MISCNLEKFVFFPLLRFSRLSIPVQDYEKLITIVSTTCKTSCKIPCWLFVVLFCFLWMGFSVLMMIPFLHFYIQYYYSIYWLVMWFFWMRILGSLKFSSHFHLYFIPTVCFAICVTRRRGCKRNTFSYKKIFSFMVSWLMASA